MAIKWKLLTLFVISILGFSHQVNSQDFISELLKKARQGNAKDGPERPNYSLLWEISGNGLEKPSYLFGTMHVRDKRAFQFSDSVLLYLDRSDIFASEIHPDSLISGQWSNVYFNPKDISIQELVQDTSKLGFKELKYKRPMLLASMLSRSQPKDDDMPTFVDAYLFHLARIQNKPTRGLESIAEQFAISYEEEYLSESYYSFDFLFYNKKSYDLIELYQEGDVALIDSAMYKGMNTGYRYVLLTKRNIHMADRMEEIMKQGKSVFAAVGTAHLPAEDGMVELFRQKGYTVRKVSPTFDLKIAQHYIERRQDRQWYNFSQPHHGYSLELPSKPYATAEVEGSFRVHQYPDIGTNDVYTAFCVDYRNLDSLNIQQKELERKVIISLLQSSDSNKFESKKAVNINGLEGLEVVISKDDGRYFRVRIFFKSEQMFVHMLTTEKDNLYATDAERFFQSFKAFEPEPYQPRKEVSSYPVIDKQGAFSAVFPRNPMYCLTYEDIPDEEDEGTYKYHLFINQNLPTGNEFMIRYHDNPIAYVNYDDSASIMEYEGGMWFGKDTVLDVNLGEYKGKEFLSESKSKYYNQKVRKRVFIRGARTYYLYVKLADEQDSLAAEQFFNEFEFLDYVPTAFDSTYTSEIDGFSLSFPSDIITITDTLTGFNSYYGFEGIDKRREYEARDDNTGNAYYLVVSDYSKYYDVPDTDSLYRRVFYEYFYSEADGDSIISQQILNIDGVETKEWILDMGKISSNIHVRTALNDGKLYMQYAYISPETFAKGEYLSFFESFKWNIEPKKSEYLFEPKANALLSDLASPDSAINALAKEALDFYLFNETHLKSLKEAVLQDYEDDTLDFDGSRSALISSIYSIESEGFENIKALKDIFPDLSAHQKMQLKIFRLLINNQDEEGKGMNAFFNLNSKYEIGYLPKNQTYGIFRQFYDSLELAVDKFPYLIAGAKKGNFQPELVSLVNQMITNKEFSSDFLMDYKPDFIEMFNNQYAILKTSTDSTDLARSKVFLPKIMRILELFSEDKILVKQMKEVVKEPLPAIQHQAAYFLLSSGKKLKKAIWDSLEVSLPDWYTLLQKLDKKKQVNKVPAEMLSQEVVAKADIYHCIARNRGSAPTHVEFIRTEEVEIKGKQRQVYIYKFQHKRNPDIWYLALSGPQPIEGESIDFSSEYTRVDWSPMEEEADELESQIKKLVAKTRYGRNYYYNDDYDF